MTREETKRERDEPSEVSVWRRLGHALLGAVLAAMGFWIIPYQLERGDVLKTLVGAGLAVVGGLTLVRAALGRGPGPLDKVVDALSGLS